MLPGAPTLYTACRPGPEREIPEVAGLFLRIEAVDTRPGFRRVSRGSRCA